MFIPVLSLSVNGQEYKAVISTSLRKKKRQPSNLSQGQQLKNSIQVHRHQFLSLGSVQLKCSDGRQSGKNVFLILFGRSCKSEFRTMVPLNALHASQVPHPLSRPNLPSTNYHWLSLFANCPLYDRSATKGSVTQTNERMCDRAVA